MHHTDLAQDGYDVFSIRIPRRLAACIESQASPRSKDSTRNALITQVLIDHFYAAPSKKAPVASLDLSGLNLSVL